MADPLPAGSLYSGGAPHCYGVSQRGTSEGFGKDAQPQPAKDERQADVEANNDPKEAWAISQFQSSKASSLTMLMIIGKVLNIFYALQEYLFREESDATHRALCLHCLLFNFCKFLLHVILS